MNVLLQLVWPPAGFLETHWLPGDPLASWRPTGFMETHCLPGDPHANTTSNVVHFPHVVFLYFLVLSASLDLREGMGIGGIFVQTPNFHRKTLQLLKLIFASYMQNSVDQ